MTPFKNWSKSFFSVVLSVSTALAPFSVYAQDAAQAPRRIIRHNPGPDVTTPMGREVIDIFASNPDFGRVSMELAGYQKFRTQDGLLYGRTLFGSNEVKAVAFGQDGTHGAKMAGHSAAGASFGGAAQGLLNHFGADVSASFSNEFLSTIYGQYGSADAPYVEISEDGTPKIKFTKITENGLWTMANDPKSPIAAGRNRYIDWLLRQNRDSLKLMVMFGGAAKDGLGAFLESKGMEVETFTSMEDLKRRKVPVFKIVSAGSNAEFAYPVDKEGKDVYSIVAGRKLDYKNEKDAEFFKVLMATLSDREFDFKQKKDVELAKKIMATFAERGFEPSNQEDVARLKKLMADKKEKALSLMVFTHSGVHGSGLLHPAQMGGFRFTARIRMPDGKQRSVALNLNGMSLSDGTRVNHDVLVAELPHPTALGMMRDAEARQDLMNQKLSLLDYYKERGWRIEPDAGFTNNYDLGKELTWGKAKLPKEHFEAGIPGIRATHQTDAGRLSVKGLDKGNHIATVSSAGRVEFDIDEITRAYKTPVPLNNPQDILVSRARGENCYEFSTGPSERFERAEQEPLTPEVLAAVFAEKEGMSLKKDGVNALRVASHPDLLDYAHTRGNLERPKVLIVADRVWGFDDVTTSVAQSGERGQYYQGLMNDMNVNNDYAVFDTVPFSMEGKSKSDWSYVLEQTNEYRERMITEFVRNGTVQAILADGTNAAAEVRRISKKLGLQIPIVEIKSTGGGDRSQGIVSAGKELSKKVAQFAGLSVSGQRVDIPRAHLTFWSDLYQGTGTDRVVNSKGVTAGRAVARVVPEEAFKQQTPTSLAENTNIAELRAMLAENGYRWANESMADYLERMKSANPNFDPSFAPETSNVRKLTRSAPAGLSTGSKANKCVKAVKSAG